MVFLNPVHKFFPSLIPQGEHPSPSEYILPSVVSGAMLGSTFGAMKYFRYGGSSVVRLGIAMYYGGALFGLTTTTFAILHSFRGESRMNSAAAGCAAGTMASTPLGALFAMAYEANEFTITSPHQGMSQKEKRKYLDSFQEKRSEV